MDESDGKGANGEASVGCAVEVSGVETLPGVLRSFVDGVRSPGAGGEPLLRRLREASYESAPRLREASRNSARDLLSWTKRGSGLRAILVISVGTITLIALTGLLIFMFFLLVATANAIIVSVLMSLAAAGGFLAMFFACLVAVYIGAVSVAVFVISTMVISAIVGVMIATGWVGFFWMIWFAARKSMDLTKHSIGMTNSAIQCEGTTVALQDLPRGTAAGDFLDAIVVGLDMLIKRFGNTKGKQRLCLITDAQHPLRDPPQGTKEDQVDTIAEQMKRHDIKMDCIVFRESGVHHNSVMDENDQLLYRFRDRSVAKVVQVDSPTSLLGALKTRNVLPVTVFRGDLEVSSNFKIKVWVYKKTSEEKFPTLKKYSDKAPPSDKFASHEVKVDYEYKSVLEPDTVVPPDQRIKGYHYGPQVVPISSAEWEAVKFKPEKGVKLLGFADRSSILRHYFMKDVYSFIPEPGNTKATVAVSAIARAMQETNKAAILRCVWRQGQGNVAFGVLTPNISSVNNAPDSFYFNILPFAEDIREFQFRSFSSLPSSSQPTEEQQEAADNLVKMLDLAPPGREEILRPDFTPNPMLERFYNFLHLKSKQPDANVPPLDGCLRRITVPDPDVIDQAPLIKNLGKAFELKENPKKKKARTQERLTYTGADDQPKLLEEPSAEKVGKMENLYPPTEKVGTIGDLNPVQDFEAMLTERSSSTWVQKAIEEMQKYTTALLENSREGDDYQKALECFVALRKACIIEQEPTEFNRFLTKLYERLRMVGDVAKFFQLLSSKNVSLISKEEAPDSDVTEEMARSFYLKPERSSQ